MFGVYGRMREELLFEEGMGFSFTRARLKWLKVRAVRRGVWFRVLSRAERAYVDLTVLVVGKVRSRVLHRVLCSLLVKLSGALESPVERAMRGVGVEQALRLSEVARRWGNVLAAFWAKDAGFIRFLAVSSLNG